MILCGLSGYARVGKDTAGKTLSPFGFKRVSFADKLKQVAYETNPWVDQANMWLADVVDLVGWEKSKDFPEVRTYLQKLGMSVRKNLGENVWVDGAFNGLEESGLYVVTDVRFWNEAEAIKARGGKVIRISRPGYGPVNDHISEVGLDQWQFDAIVINDASIPDLGEQIMEVLSLVH